MQTESRNQQEQRLSSVWLYIERPEPPPFPLSLCREPCTVYSILCTSHTYWQRPHNLLEPGAEQLPSASVKTSTQTTVPAVVTANSSLNPGEVSSIPFVFSLCIAFEREEARMEEGWDGATIGDFVCFSVSSRLSD